jgi:hypothetical protein
MFSIELQLGCSISDTALYSDTPAMSSPIRVSERTAIHCLPMGGNEALAFRRHVQDMLRFASGVSATTSAPTVDVSSLARMVDMGDTKRDERRTSVRSSSGCLQSPRLPGERGLLPTPEYARLVRLDRMVKAPAYRTSTLSRLQRTKRRRTSGLRSTIVHPPLV